MKQTGDIIWKQVNIARALGVSERTLRRRLRRCGLTLPSYKGCAYVGSEQLVLLKAAFHRSLRVKPVDRTTSPSSDWVGDACKADTAETQDEEADEARCGRRYAMR